MLSNPLHDRYGPIVEEYLNPNTHACKVQSALPSRQDILDAITLLSEPDEVTYQTFETILALEWSPACINLDLLASDAAQTSLPACFRLIKSYCEGGNRRMLDHAYGFQCLRVISLFVQFAIISQAENLNLLFTSNALRSKGESITPEFNDFTCNIMIQLISERINSRRSTGKYKLETLGWSIDPSTGDGTCLAKLGGLAADEINDLFEKLWGSRDQLLYVATQTTTALFPGLGGLLCWMWSAIAWPFDLNETQASQTTWAHFVDLLIRFTLCCSEYEAQLASVLYSACHQFGSIPISYFETENMVDTCDSARISVETVRKLGSDSGLHIDLITALVAYAGPNVSFSNSIVPIMKAGAERLCIELGNIQRCEDLSNGLLCYFEMYFFTLTRRVTRN
ncbi:unnamed protein product [Rhizoctonia solani]|uniref:Uncharacterized protein n=1 Tax=Rhizoctonia solani TaxID=456999 RepID=A0A8H3D617_9AGAM|nr:unnamed protein product [Rhizoctonia solani]